MTHRVLKRPVAVACAECVSLEPRNLIGHFVAFPDSFAGFRTANWKAGGSATGFGRVDDSK